METTNATDHQLDSMAMEFYGTTFNECDEDQKHIVSKEVDGENINELQQEQYEN